MTHSTPPIIWPAQPKEANLLTQIALQSKAYWGYSKEFMQSCEEELTVDASRIRTGSHHCFVAVCDGRIVGFYALAPMPGNAFDLDALFVQPEHIGEQESASIPGRFLPLYEIGCDRTA